MLWGIYQNVGYNCNSNVIILEQTNINQVYFPICILYLDEKFA